MKDGYQALYRKWRPTVFEDVVGQNHVSDTLKNSILTGRIGHAYLFCGTRGTGKTSIAKIFSRAVNCEYTVDGNPCNECETCRGIMDGSILDVYEMDAASNSGIDHIRGIREEVNYTPTNSKYKVYIVDEAHMLTTESFNALLKTLEEPPGHVVFILATTEPHKIPATIHSRCQRFDFKRIGVDDIYLRLAKIVKEEGINITPDALELISELADGSMRDSLSILDQCAAYAKEQLKYDDIIDIIGIADKRIMFPLVDAIGDYNGAEALVTADGFLKQGKEATDFIEEMIQHFRALLLAKAMENPGELLEKSQESVEKYSAQAQKFSQERIIYIIKTLGDFLIQAKKISTPKLAVEMAVVKICTMDNQADSSELSARIEKLEKELQNLKSNGVAVKKQPAKTIASAAEQVPLKPAEPHIDEAKLWPKWRDALGVIKEKSKKLYTYLFNAKALFYGDEVELVITSDLAYEQINKPSGIEYLSGIFSEVQGSQLKVTISGKEGPRNRDGEQPSVLDIAAKRDLFGDKMTVIDD